MRFITGMQEVAQYDRNMFFTKHNQIFEDSNGVLHYTPRYMTTDGYTIYDCLAPIAGGRFEEDIRCSTAHDLWCRYKQDIIITISEREMRSNGFLIDVCKNYPNGIEKRIVACVDMPKIYLKVNPISFAETNRLFNEMLRCCEMSKYKEIILSTGVYFNFGWFLNDAKNLDLDKIGVDFI